MLPPAPGEVAAIGNVSVLLLAEELGASWGAGDGPLVSQGLSTVGTDDH